MSPLKLLFWHDRWVGDNPLKILYPNLNECLGGKGACIYDDLSYQAVGTIEFF